MIEMDSKEVEENCSYVTDDLHTVWRLPCNKPIETERRMQITVDNLRLVQAGLRPAFYLHDPRCYAPSMLRRIWRHVKRRNLRVLVVTTMSISTLDECLVLEPTERVTTNARMGAKMEWFAHWLVRLGFLDAKHLLDTQRWSGDLLHQKRFDYYSSVELSTWLITTREAGTPQVGSVELHGLELGTRLGYMQPETFYTHPTHRYPCLAIIFCLRSDRVKHAVYNGQYCLNGEYVYGTRDEVDAMLARYAARVEAWRAELGGPLRVHLLCYDIPSDTYDGLQGTAWERQFRRHDIRCILGRNDTRGCVPG